MTVASITTLNGTVEDPTATRLPRLCHLFEFEDDAEREFQTRSMAAAAEVYGWYHKPEVWQTELHEKWKAEAEENGTDPRWSWKSDRGFYGRWVADEIAKNGIAMRRNQAMNLFNAQAMREVVTAVTTAIPLPETEWAWRPAMRLYRHGFKAEIADAVRRAGEIADERGEVEISNGIMTKAVAEVWRTAPRIRDWVEQPNKPKNDETPRDVSIRIMQREQRHLEDLLDQCRKEEIKKLRDWFVHHANRIVAL